MLGLAGCQSAEFYHQAVRGQWQLMRAAQDVATLIDDPDTDADLRRQLELVNATLRFARDELGLDSGTRYQRYVDVRRPYVLWNLFAAGEFETQGHEWCYPVAGCAVYRGYFKHELAQRNADRLRAAGLDVAVVGVPAYSTLGWFDDPLLSSFVKWPERDIAALLIHELAHSRNFIAGDAQFNESYAAIVEVEGVRAWLQARGERAEVETFKRERRARERTTRFLLNWRAALDELYAQPYNEFARRQLKHAMFDAMKRCYRANARVLDQGRRGAWFEAGLDNADLVPLATYEGLAPAFSALFEASGNWQAFHRAVGHLKDLAPNERAAQLKSLGEQYVAQRTDHDDADHVQCESLAHHVGDRESTGAEHDDIGRGRDR